MHIPEGMLPGAICVVGYGLTGAALWYSLRKIKQKQNPRAEIPKASLFTAAFFISTFLLIPIPPTSVHPMLVGLLGAMLGYFAFPAITIALFFQAVLFQHGGITTLGVNAFLFGSSALLSYHLFQFAKRLFKHRKNHPAISGFIAGFAGCAIAVFLFYLVLISFIPINLEQGMERKAITILSIAHLPIMVIEGVFTAFLFRFLQKTKPSLLEVKP